MSNFLIAFAIAVVQSSRSLSSAAWNKYSTFSFVVNLKTPWEKQKELLNAVTLKPATLGELLSKFILLQTWGTAESFWTVTNLRHSWEFLNSDTKLMQML